MISMELLEGEIYQFEYLDDVTGANDVIYMKLKDPNGILHLLEKEPYKSYGFSYPMQIDIHIDKYNCNGKIYFEPLHPYYLQGKTYDFEIISSSEDNQQWSLKDISGRQISIPLSSEMKNLSVGQCVSCIVLKIKKSQMVLFPVAHQNDFSTIKPGDIKEYYVVGEESYAGLQEFYVLTNMDNERFRIRKKFYRDYGFVPGERIFAELKFHKNEMVLEPIHPFWKEGKTYDFYIKEIRSMENYNAKPIEALVLKNEWGKDIIFHSGDFNKKPIEKKKISCLVENIIKGMPVLKWIE